LQLLAGLLLFYGVEGMITTLGILPPNPVVWLGLAAVLLSTALAWRLEKRAFAGLWLSAVAVALPLLLQSAKHLSDPACPPNHPPISGSYYCVPPGALPLLILSMVVVLVALGGAISDLRANGPSRPPTPSVQLKPNQPIK
jgi:hypothetical protein